MGSSSPKGEPRSVPDEDAEAYKEMVLRQKATNDARHGAVTPDRTAPVDSAASAVVDIFGGARRARAAVEERDYPRALFEGVGGAADLYIAGAIIRGVLKGGIKTKGPTAWRTKPWEQESYRQWLGRMGFLERGQHGHHALIPNNGWGKAVPDWFKNQPWNIKGMESAEVHGRVHGRYKGKPQFNALERYWHGTPPWWKAANAAAAAHGGSAIKRPEDKKP